MAETVEEAVARAARTITRTDARNPAKYREVKAEAMKQGLPIIMTDPALPDPVETNAKVDVVYLTDSIIARRETVRDPAAYRRLREEADKSNRTFLTVEALDAIADDALQARVNAAIADRDPGALRTTKDPLAGA